MPQLFTDDTAYAESLFDKFDFNIPSGAAQLAVEKGVNIEQLSEAYGQIIAQKIQEDIPFSLDASVLSAACLRAGQGDESIPFNSLGFESWLATVRTAVADKKKVDPLTGELLEEVSRTYGSILGKTARLTAMQLDFNSLTKRLEQCLLDKALPFPMDQAKFNEMFSTLEDCATDVLGTANLDTADQFFQTLASDDAVVDLQGDGYIFAVNGKFSAIDSEQQAEEDSTVQVALQVRLLDGRVILVPTYSDGANAEVDYIQASLSSLPLALSCAIRGMRALESRTVFYHPYAAHEVLSLLVNSAQLPPQAGAVVDIFLKKVV